MVVRLYFTANPQRAEAVRLKEKLMGQAKKLGFEVLTLEQVREEGDPSGILVVVGGDGSLLRQVPLALQTGMPLWGIHGGTVGFLTESTEETFVAGLEALKAGQYTRDKRKLLGCRFLGKEGELEPAALCLNDALLYKRSLSGVARIHIRIDGEEAGVVSGDGVIVSGPTGSTAYSLSCGGPVLTRDVDALVITPVCPHNLHMRPVVAPFSSRVELFSDDACMAVADGNRVSCMDPGSRLEVAGSQAYVSFVRFGRSNLFARIHQRLT